jgi:protein prenyltransferase alpha subunit repeat containing protein 1
VDTFVAQEVNLLRECMNAPSDEFEESRVQAELAALYIIWISKAITTSFNQLASQ